jgi:hypothetical protein
MSEIHTSPDKTFPFLLNTGELAALGKKRIGEFVRVQQNFSTRFTRRTDTGSTASSRKRILRRNLPRN